MQELSGTLRSRPCSTSRRALSNIRAGLHPTGDIFLLPADAMHKPHSSYNIIWTTAIHRRYKSVLSFGDGEWWRSGRDSRCGGVVFLTTKNKAEEYSSTFKHIQLMNRGGHGKLLRQCRKAPRPYGEKLKIENLETWDRSLGGEGGESQASTPNSKEHLLLLPTKCDHQEEELYKTHMTRQRWFPRQSQTDIQNDMNFRSGAVWLPMILQHRCWLH